VATADDRAAPLELVDPHVHPWPEEDAERALEAFPPHEPLEVAARARQRQEVRLAQHARQPDEELRAEGDVADQRGFLFET
jgi:hypothetical protein